MCVTSRMLRIYNCASYVLVVPNIFISLIVFITVVFTGQCRQTA